MKKYVHSFEEFVRLNSKRKVNEEESDNNETFNIGLVLDNHFRNMNYKVQDNGTFVNSNNISVFDIVKIKEFFLKNKDDRYIIREKMSYFITNIVNKIMKNYNGGYKLIESDENCLSYKLTAKSGEYEGSTYIVEIPLNMEYVMKIKNETNINIPDSENFENSNNMSNLPIKCLASITNQNKTKMCTYAYKLNNFAAFNFNFENSNITDGDVINNYNV